MQTHKKLNTKAAADFLADLGVEVSPGTMEVWRCTGRGPRYHKVGRWVRYAPTDLEVFARGRVVETIDSLAS